MREPFSLEESEDRTRRAVDELAPHISDLERGLSESAEDIKLFVEHLSGKKMLDVGCGWGRYAPHFVKRGLDYCGIDLSPKMIEIARSRNPTVPFEVMSFRQLRFPDNSFDGLWNVCVLMHEPKSNLQAVLGEMKRVIKPGGVLLVILQDVEVVGEWISTIRSKESTVETHCSFWDFEEFADALQAAELEILSAMRWYNRGSMSFLVRK